MIRFLFLKVKNPNPWQVVLAATIALSLVEFALFFTVFKFMKLDHLWMVVATIVIVHFYLSYLIVYNAMEYFVYRKIKTIYKAIARSKYTKDKVASIMDLDNDILKEVQRDVLMTLESEKHEVEQLKQLEEYRKQFLGNVSHELKTPIFNIQGYIETLIDGGMDDASINLSYLKKASKNVARLNTIVKDLEMISQIEDGKLSVDPHRFNFHELVSETIEGLSLISKQYDVFVSIKSSLMNPCYVKADKERIRQVMVNLVSNAIRYNKPHGKVSIGAYDLDEKILIEVSDTGIGIPEKYLNRIFERFFRVDKSRSRDLGGTGLGLSIVKHILDAHNQSITVRSTLNEGSTFSFTLDKA